MQRSARRSTPYGAIMSPPRTAARFLEYVDAIHLRELSFGAGGIGCALWNASILLSRFIMDNSHLFKGKVVSELGAGVGLPLLTASRHCRRAIFSDYMTSLVNNFDYNVACNVNQLEDVETKLNADGIKIQINTTKHFQHSPIWDLIAKNAGMCEKQIEDEENDIISPDPERDYPKIDIQKASEEMYSENCQINPFVPNTCLNHNSTCGCIGYEVPQNYNTMNYSDDKTALLTHRLKCLENMRNSCQGILLDWLNFDQLPKVLQNDLKTDIILGSELCYPTILDCLPALSTLIQHTLSEYGVFYLIQSPNRGTSRYFIEELCAKQGFLLDMRQVDLSILEQFSSGQRDESYVYYTFRRPQSPYPIMGMDQDYVAPIDGLSPESMVLINTNSMKLDTDGVTLIPGCEVNFETKLAQPVGETAV